MKTDAGVEVQLHSFLTRKGLISSTFTNRFKVTVRWIYVFLGSFVQLRKLSISFVISVYLSVRLSVWNNSAPAIRNFLKFDIWVFLEKIFEKIKVWLKSNKNNGYFTRRHTFLIISRSFLLRMRSASEKSYRKYQDKHFMFDKFFLENRVLYEIMWKNIVEPAGHRWQYYACALYAGQLRHS